MIERDIQGELEATVLGLLLRSTSALDTAISLGLNADAFQCDRHRIIFLAIVGCAELRLSIDITTVAKRMPLEQSPLYLVQLLDNAPVAQNDSFHIRELIAASWRSKTALRLSSLSRRLALLGGPSALADLQAEAIAVLTEIGRGGIQFEFATADPEEIVKRFEKNLNISIEAHQAGGRLGIGTGLAGLDLALGGWMPGSLYILGARTSLGKTTFAVNFLHSALVQGKHALFFTNEMQDHQILGKLISLRTKILGSRIYTGDLTGQQREKISDTLFDVAFEPLAINHKAGRQWESFSAECRRLRRAGCLDLVIQDYIQQMRWPSRRWTSRNEELSEISTALKELAMELQVPIIAVAQLNREAERASERGEPPNLANLKDCGALEQDADAIILLDRSRDDDVGAAMSLIVAKNRFGKVGSFQIYANLAENRFSDKFSDGP